MSVVPKISATEWAVMKVVWSEAPCSAAHIIDRLAAQDASWHPKTVKTLLNRLVKKRALDFQRGEGRAYLYKPRVAEQDCVIAESESFLDRVHGGSLTPLVAHFIQRRKLTRRQIAELKKLLDDQEET